MFFRSLLFHEICFLLGTYYKGCFNLFNLEQIGKVIVTSVKDIVSTFLVWYLRLIFVSLVDAVVIWKNAGTYASIS